MNLLKELILKFKEKNIKNWASAVCASKNLHLAYSSADLHFQGLFRKMLETCWYLVCHKNDTDEHNEWIIKLYVNFPVNVGHSEVPVSEQRVTFFLFVAMQPHYPFYKIVLSLALDVIKDFFKIMI